MNVQHFIDKFEAIPEERWGVGVLQAEDNTRCALGHCIPQLDSFPGVSVGSCSEIRIKFTDEGEELIDLMMDKLHMSVVDINDGNCPEYWQPTPKQRILAALRDIQSLEQQDEAVEEANLIIETKRGEAIWEEIGKVSEPF